MPFIEGMLHGHFSSFGQFDQCIGIKSPKQESGRTIYGKYCQIHTTGFTPPISSYTPHDEVIFKQSSLYTTYFKLFEQLNVDKYMHKDFSHFMTQVTDFEDEAMFHFGICMPHSCTGEDIQKVLNESKLFLGHFLFLFLTVKSRLYLSVRSLGC